MYKVGKCVFWVLNIVKIGQYLGGIVACNVGIRSVSYHLQWLWLVEEKAERGKCKPIMAISVASSGVVMGCGKISDRLSEKWRWGTAPRLLAPTTNQIL